MHIDTRIKRKRRLSMTSLIDVIFLLLLFFMLSSTFTRFAEIDIAAGRGGQAPTNAVAPDVFVRLDGERGWKINGAAMSADLAIEELQRLEGDGAKSALVVVRDNVSSQMLVEALERIAGKVKLKISVAG